MQTRFILSMMILGTLISCRQEEQFIEISLVDPALEPYFRAFESEANARGITLNARFSDIEASIENINDGDVVGECWYNSHATNEIRIDRTYWQRSSTLGREMVVFHELGHCYLLRDHTESATASGTCISIMDSGTGSCINRYSASTRDAYLDELFFPD